MIEGVEAVAQFDWKPGLLPVTPHVFRSEPVWGLQEKYAGNPRQRYQIIVVVRGDALAECWVPMPGIEGREIDIFCALGNSVAEAMDWANEMRVDRTLQTLMDEETQDKDLRRDLIEAAYQDVEIIKNRSSFGPLVSVQRDGWSSLGNRLRREETAHGR